MNRIRNSLKSKIVLFNILIVLLLSLIVYFYLPWRLKTFAVQERVKVLSPLNEQATLYLHYYLQNVSANEGGEKIQDNEVIRHLSHNSDFSYAMFISASEPTTPHILYGNDKALQVSDPFKKKLEKTEVVEKADMLHVISPIAGYDQEGREVKLGFLISGFSLESMKEVIRKTNYIIVMLCVAFIVLGIISGVIQSRFLVTPLKKTMGLIDTIAQGDFARGLEYSSQDELGELMLTLNTMITTWKHSIEKIKDAIDLSNSASREISIVAHQQEKITSKEASSVSEITTTVEELNTSSEQISGEAEKIVQASRDVLKIVSDGQHYVSEGIGEFNDIRERVNAIAEHVLTLRLEAQQIGGIVKEVSSIANKTDMLAINAGIEAARAGEQGKGFSVVASEIRDLADQSQKSADKISSLIEKIQASTHATMMVTKQGTKGVEQGIKLILETGHTLKASIATIQETVDSVQEIALSSKQQSLGTDQVSQTMRGINEGMKETATAATQTHKEAKRLQILSHELQEMIHSYKV